MAQVPTEPPAEVAATTSSPAVSDTAPAQTSPHDAAPKSIDPAPAERANVPNGVSPPSLERHKPAIGPIAQIPPFGVRASSVGGNSASGSVNGSPPKSSPPIVSPVLQPVQTPVASTSASTSAATTSTTVAPSATGATVANVVPLVPYRPLNVRDALTYLDEVKIQFHSMPEVYNRFLDIMKDFKTQNIDTPGVIDRVSMLFRGHPQLIQGFNTFLPPGYRIECQTADDGSNTALITVTTPSGTITRTQPLPSLGLTAQQRINGTPDAGLSTNKAPKPIDAGLGGGMNHLALPPPDVTQLPSVVTPGAASVLGGMQRNDVTRPLLEFNHAISYVNKIKQRYVSDPQTCKIFLEILQTYQKEQRPIQEVYRQVTQLFAGATDLLEEFKQFLPDTSDQSQNRPSNYFEDAAMVRGEIKDAPPMRRGVATLSQVAGASNRSLNRDASSTKKRSSRYVDQPAPAPTPKPRRHKHAQPRAASPQPSSRFDETVLSYRGSSQAEQRQQADAAAMARIHLLGLPGAPLTSSEELAFFDRAKKFFDDRPTYQEFLKLLNLFTAEIIDLSTLVNQAYLFLGDSDELFAQFKELVGWDSSVDGLVHDEEWIVDNVNALERPKFEVQHLKFFPPSYRRLPQTEIDLACSGRDALCWSVLNDEWISHRTWSSEYSGAHRKSPYEDVLAIAEQERHWFDYQIEVLARAISAFEPVLMRIDRMSPEDRAVFRLEKGLGGGHTASVYERAIRKIYGADREQATHFQFRSDHCSEIIKSLYDNPVVAVPTILRRLKQKDEEWRRARREWNRMWREVDVLNWYRSLDHQGQPFKQSDRRYIQPKMLVREIDDLRMKGSKKVVGLENETADTSSRHQFEFHISDKDVLFDMFKLFLAYIDRVAGSSISTPERDRCETFFRSFVCLMFNMSSDELDDGVGASEIDARVGEPTMNGIDSKSAPDSLAPTTPATEAEDSEMEVDDRFGAGKTSSLRRHLLSNTVEAGGSQFGSRAPSPVDTETAEPSGLENPIHPRMNTDLGQEKTWIRVEDPALGINGSASVHMTSQRSNDDKSMDSDGSLAPIARRYNFFCGTTHYALVRLLHLAYHRLLQAKKMAVDISANYKPRLSSFAVELGLATELPIIDLVENGAANPGYQYYQHTLHLCEEFFEGSREKEGRTNGMDASNFEEQLRYMYGIKAYWLFTIDKLMSAILKYIHISNSDADMRSRSLMELLRKDRAAPQQTLRQQIAWRMQAEDIVGRVYEGKDSPPPEALYRIEWLPAQNMHIIQLLGPDDLTLDEAFDGEDRWEYYRSSYMLTASTEGIGAGVLAPLLKRNRDLVASSTEESLIQTSSAPAASLDRSSYRLRWAAGSVDTLLRRAAPGLNNTEGDTKKRRADDLWAVRGQNFRAKLDTLIGDDAMEE